jgi:hypothetical protein
MEVTVKKIIVILVIMALPLLCHASDYASYYSKSKALVIGINKYLLWPHLEYAAKDAQEISELLEEQKFDVKLLLDERATKQNITSEIDRLLRDTDKNSRILLYFAGHGQTEDKPGGGEKGYLVPVDADLYDWNSTALSMKEINQEIKRSNAKHIFLAFDSCYSGLGLTRGIKLVKKQDPGYIDKMMRLRSIQVLTAGGRSEQAIEADGHGLFTDHLLAALSGAADMNLDGYATGTEIYATLRPSVTKLSFNRQTPQFGYIEGEGDFIFKIQQKTAEPAYITVSTLIDGVDVWINGIEKGHRLSKADHKIDTRSGRNNVLVKKGGRTLFSKKIELRPNQNYLVNIETDKHISKKRQPFSMFTIANRNIKNYSNSIAYDLDKDGLEEIITSSGRSLFVFKKDGSVLWEKTYNFSIGLNLVDEYNNKPVIALSGRNHDIIHLFLLDNNGSEIWHKERKIEKYYQGKPDGGGSIAKLADINDDGKKEIIAFTSAGYVWKPRGIILYEQSGREMWRYLIGPSPTSIGIWEHGRGRPDIIIGTYSPGNGNRERHNNTDDMHAYVISIDGYGKTNWVKNLGTHFTGTKVILSDIDGDGSQELYAQKWTAYDYRKDEGAVYQFNRNGRIINSFEINDSIKSVVFSKYKNKPNLLYATDKDGVVYHLDKDLNIITKKAMNKESIPLMINLVGVHDYDGDSEEDVLLYSFNRLQEGQNPRSDYGPRNKVFYTNMKYQILSRDLSRVIKEVSIAEEWDKWRGFKLIEIDRPEMPQYPFIALSDKITIFNY